MGKKLCEVYPYATWWEVLKWRMTRIFRVVFLVAFLAGLSVGSFKIGSEFFGKPVYAEKIVLTDSLGKKIEELKRGVVADIQKCESAGHKEDDGIIIFDSNEKASIGTMQWQKASVIHYYKKLYKQDITSKEAVLIALDDKRAESLAYDVIFTEKEGWRNWFNCGVKIEVKRTLDIISKLER